MTLPGAYIARRLLIALPSLLGISIVLFTVLTPGDPFGELATNRNIPGAARQWSESSPASSMGVEFSKPTR
jgi:ABC-type microcin C transport system permease subunit YejB